MNLYQLAADAINNKSQWASGESIELFSNTTRSANIKRDSYGKIQMFIVVKNDLRKNAQVANMDLSVGYPGRFVCSPMQYKIWSTKIKGVL